ncbi:MAG: DNA polymerase IV [Verrucomicrobiia bacterium]|jgi:nucleotidyltransferase/DNA polymerase involved in DNA repair
MPTNRTILHVDMDAFFTSVEQRDRPELRGKPVVVGAPPDKRGVVAAASYEARKFGIHSAMPSRTAFRLCPQAVFLRGDHAKYDRESERVMTILRQFTPLVEQVSVDEAYLDVTASLRLLGTGEQIAREIKRRIHEATGLTASVGVAPNMFLAKLASDMRKPDGLMMITDLNKLDLLRPLPIGRIAGIGKKTEPVFHDLGIHTVGDLQRFPIETLRAKFGVWADEVKARAMGEDDRPVESCSEVKSISNETTFDEDMSELGMLERVVRELADEVGRRLRAEGVRARTVQLKLRWANFTTLTRRATLPEATDDEGRIAAVALQLMRVELKEPRPVRLIGVGGQNLLRSPRQLELLDRSSNRRDDLNRVADAVRAKFGAKKLRRGGEL